MHIFSQATTTSSFSKHGVNAILQATNMLTIANVCEIAPLH